MYARDICICLDISKMYNLVFFTPPPLPFLWSMRNCRCLDNYLWIGWTFSFKGYVPYIVPSFHLVVCLTTGPKPLPKRALHIVRSRASSFKWEYPLLSLRPSNSFLRLLPCLSVTSIPPCIFPSVTRCRRHFLRKMWPIQFAFRLRISCRIFLCYLTLSSTSSFLTWSIYRTLSRRKFTFRTDQLPPPTIANRRKGY
jgi:hypothetical protein